MPKMLKSKGLSEARKRREGSKRGGWKKMNAARTPKRKMSSHKY